MPNTMPAIPRMTFERKLNVEACMTPSMMELGGSSAIRLIGRETAAAPNFLSQSVQSILQIRNGKMVPLMGIEFYPR
jgi:hypothetical protein